MPVILLRAHRPRGLVLFLVCALVVVLTLSVAVLAEQATQSLRQARLGVAQRQALGAADLGLQSALAAVRTQGAWVAAAATPQALPSLQGATYELQGTDNLLGQASVVAPDGTQVPPGVLYLRSTGTAPGGGRRTVSALLRQPTASRAVAALWGDLAGSIGGSAQVDAYSSGLGDYGPATRVAVGAVVGTNGSASRVLVLGGSTVVDGNLQVGPGSTAASVSGASRATGTVQVRDAALSMPLPVAPQLASTVDVAVGDGQELELAPGGYGNLSMSGQSTLRLSRGTYVFAAGPTSTGSVTLTGGSRLIIADGGPVTIYFAGSWSASGSAAINPDARPGALQVLGTATATEVDFQMSAQARMLLYAPSAAVKQAGGSVVYGSLMGRSFALQGGASSTTTPAWPPREA